MRIAALAFVSVLAMAACSPSAPSNGAANSGSAASSSGSSGGGGGFPQAASNASFRQEATMTINGSAIPEVIYHDGAKIRTEMNGPAGQMINIINSDTHEAFSIMHVGGRTMATRTDLSQVQTGTHAPVDVDALRAQMQSRAHRLGSCSAAGENGSEWTVDAPEGVTTTGSRSMCVTSDGIMIQMKVNGALVFDTQSLQRGPQDASLFQLPPGVQVTNTRIPSQASIADAVARARAAAAAAQGTP
jgi:hypothetical protein